MGDQRARQTSVIGIHHLCGGWGCFMRMSCDQSVRWDAEVSAADAGGAQVKERFADHDGVFLESPFQKLAFYFSRIVIRFHNLEGSSIVERALLVESFHIWSRDVTVALWFIDHEYSPARLCRTSHFAQEARQTRRRNMRKPKREKDQVILPFWFPCK